MKSVLLILVLLLMGLGGCRREKPASCPLHPSSLIWGFGIEGFPISQEQLEHLEQETKLTAQLIQFYLQWPASRNHAEPLISSFDAIAHVGAVPCITWEPMSIVDGKEKTIAYELILNGQYDAYLAQMAQEIKEWKKPLIIRFAQEMNLNRYHWGTTEEQFGPQSSEIYINMFRYVVNFFRNQEVNNVLWAFCPNVDSIPNQPWNKAQAYYPGDDYVDILGMDGYNWAMTPELAKEKNISWTKPWLSFAQLFQNLYHELKQIAPSKPILVFETASVNQGTNKKSLWIKEALHTAKNWEIVGIIWFQAKKEEDWRIHQEDYAYVPLVRSAISPFQEWLECLKTQHSISAK
jgi:hypothetical protein